MSDLDKPMRIFNDVDNKAHGPHYDAITPLPDLKAAEQIRVAPEGEVIGGTTNVGPIKMHWDVDKKP
jgi:hypothetical protein